MDNIFRWFAIKIAVIIMTLSILLLIAKAGAVPIEEWNKTFGGIGEDEFRYVKQTSDNGFILIGFTDSYGAGGSDAWLVKTDSQGKEQWNRTFGGLNDEEAYSGQQTSDGGFVLVGFKWSSYNKVDTWLIKTDASGIKQWDKIFNGYNLSYSVQQTSDGGYVLVGIIGKGEYVRIEGQSSPGIPHVGYVSRDDVFLIKTDAKGNLLWNRTFGGPKEEGIGFVQQTSDRGYILSGYSFSYGTNDNDAWLIKTDANGIEQWNKTFRGTNFRTFNSITQTYDGGYLLACRSPLGPSIYRPISLTKIDMNGNEQWNRVLGESDGSYWIHSVQQTLDKEFILAGSIFFNSLHGYDTNALLMKIDIKGNEQWNKTFGGEKYEEIYNVQQTSDGDYILAGKTDSFGDDDAWLLKVSNESLSTPTTTDMIIPSTLTVNPTPIASVAQTSTPIIPSEKSPKTSASEKVEGFEIIIAIITLFTVYLFGRKYLRRL